MSVLPQTENHVSSESATVASRRQTVSIWNRLAGYVQNWGTAVVIALLGLVVWELSVRLFDVQEWLLPPVSKILSELITDPPLFISNGWVTLREILVGFMVSTTFGFVMATGMFWSRLLERSVYPFLIASQTVPVFTLAPLLVIWTGTGMTPKVVIVVLFTFFPITIGLMTGLRSVDADMIAMFRTLGASKWQMFTKLHLPSALPYLFAGLKVAAVVSVIGAVIGEWIGASAGLGWLIKTSGSRYQTDKVFAAIFTLSVMASMMFILISLVQARMLRHYHQSDSEGATN
ncbi:MAG: ABC transporter permease [Chloroflexi bacterium]|nr:ABC transporter permease [Chloroflexota bacterium]MYF79882.1 ABC transporter permease [Chloroflexota bacterium]MYK60415.1 ABC transporter permease [Chloroflexota bacterium]